MAAVASATSSGGAPLVASPFDREATVASPVNSSKDQTKEANYQLRVKSTLTENDFPDVEFQIHVSVDGKNVVDFPAFELLVVREDTIPSSFVSLRGRAGAIVEITRRDLQTNEIVLISLSALPATKETTCKVTLPLEARSRSPSRLALAD